MADLHVLKTRSVTSSIKPRIIMPLVIIFLLDLYNVHAVKLYFDNNDVDILLHETKIVKLIQIGKFNTALTMTAEVQHTDIIEITPQTLEIPGSSDPSDKSTTKFDLSLYGASLGNTEIGFNFSPPDFVKEYSVFLRVAVMRSGGLQILSTIMGWIYFLAWSVSFYPQIYINFKRKSVIGLNFDFLALNIVGFSLYSVFNCGMYFVSSIQEEYFSRHPRGINPVFMNDVFFSLHAAFATCLTIGQCCVYVRGNQRVATWTRGVLCAFGGVLVSSIGLSIGGRIAWLDCLYNCSYIKLCTTFIKYVPQAYMNYKRKSTVGWSIGNILLDFVGGSLSVAQKVVNAYNFDDWTSFFGNFTKLGIGIFSLSFDIFFMLQHYVLYRDRQDTGTPNAMSREPPKAPPAPPSPSPPPNPQSPPSPPSSTSPPPPSSAPGSGPGSTRRSTPTTPS